MPRKVGWEDESITGGFGNDDEDKYKGVKGETHVIRVMVACEEYRVHAVDDVLEPDKDGEPRVFNANCSKEWEDASEDWDGDCTGCDDRDYDVAGKFITGILLLAIFKGRSKTPMKIDPENSVKFWPFGADKYRKLSDIALELTRAEEPKKIHQVELVVKVDKSDQAELFQKLNINISQQKRYTTAKHIAEFKARGPDMVSGHVKGPSVREWKRILKKRRGKRGKGGSSEETGPRKTKAKKDRDEEPQDEDEDDTSTGDEDLDALLEDL